MLIIKLKRPISLAIFLLAKILLWRHELFEKLYFLG